MSKKLIYIIVMLLVTGSVAKAESVIEGIVRDKENKKPIEGVVITLLNDAGETLAYGISRNDGKFSVEVTCSAPRLTVQTRLLGYEADKRIVDNRSQRLTIELMPGKVELREVVVKSRPIWDREDTLVYSVNAFKTLGDKTIGDILKKLPGVEVSESGGIKYQGEPINKFYIEGLNLLENRYGIATNNIPVEAVQNVEIIENHEPLKVLKDFSASDKAAINLKLKKEKMDRPVGTATLGSGISDEWLRLAEVFALNAGKNRQYIVMYKTNNTANDIATDLTAQSLSTTKLRDVSDYSEKTLFDAEAFSYPPLEKKRYLFNDSHVASVNSLWKTGENSQLRINAQYLHDMQHETVIRNSDYFLPGSILHIDESSVLSRKSNMLDASLTFTDNSSTHYFNNELKWMGTWDKTSSSVATNGFGVQQYFKLPAQVLKNDLNYVKRTKKRVWDFSSFTIYTSQPQQLNVGVDTANTMQAQTATLSGLYSRNSTYLSFGTGHSNMTVKAVLEAASDKFRSALYHPFFTDSTRSDVTAGYLNMELIPSYTYRNDRLTANADVTLRRHTLWVNNCMYGTDNTYSFAFADPSFEFSYKATPMLTMRTSYRYSHTVGDFRDITDTYFMSAYRTFNKRSGILAQTERQSCSGGIQYRNPLTTFFFNTSLMYATTKRNLISSQRFEGTESVSGTRPFDTRSNMWMWQGYTGKYISGIRTTISLSASYTSTQGKLLQQGVLFPYYSSGWSFLPKINVKLSDNCSVSYHTILTDHITKITSAANIVHSSIWQATQQLSGFYLIGKQWQINARAEHSYNEISTNNTVKMLFADIGITYKHKLVDFDLSWNNIFNRKTYSYSTYSNLDRFDYAYSLRPAMVLLTVSCKY